MSNKSYYFLFLWFVFQSAHADLDDDVCISLHTLEPEDYVTVETKKHNITISPWLDGGVIDALTDGGTWLWLLEDKNTGLRILHREFSVVVKVYCNSILSETK